MRLQSMLAAGILSMMVGIGEVNASDSDIAETNSAAGLARVGHGGSTYSITQPKSTQPGDSHGEGRRADIEERIGHGGSTYSSS